MQNFFNVPEIKDVDLSNYNGNADENILIKAIDIAKVEKVQVAINDENRLKVEYGDAVRDAIEKDNWVYLTKENIATNNFTIVVVAENIAGAKGKREVWKSKG